MKKYLCLAYYDPQKFAAMPSDAVQALVSQCPARDAQLKATGQLLVSASLGEADQVMSLRPRGGTSRATDGPFSESKELVGGLFIIEAADRDEALRIAALHPAAALGEQAGWGIEMHPIEMYQDHAAGAGG
ncbi:MAG TPA: YciI family protein [Burkholderiaceae bacterium]|nr:YciI family protein [Burkholderiaceae bacterium]